MPYLFSGNARENRGAHGDEKDVEPAKATRYFLESCFEQGGFVIVRDLPVQHQTVVVRGQHRLTHGRLVKVDQEESTFGDPVVAEVQESIHVPTLGSRP